MNPIADNVRTLPRAPELPQILLPTGPRIGLLWTAGNPAGLAFEVPDSWAELRGGFGRQDGSYRRPLDDRDAGILQLYGLGWQPLGKGAAVGRVIFDVENAQPASFADVVQEHPSNPLVVTDTSLPDVRRVRARVEGGLGWKLGGWGLGLAAGIDIWDNRTHDARFPRLMRLSTAAVAFGLARQIPIAGIALSAYGRWIGNRESVTLLGRPGTGLVYQLEGYAEPVPREVVPPLALYIRKMERTAWSWGLALDGKILGFDWILFWESTSRAEEHFSEQRADPQADKWNAGGSVWAGALQRPLLADGRLLLTGYLRYSRLDGDASRFDLEGTIFRADESVLLLGGDLRYLSPGSPWMVGLVLTLVGESRLRQDFIAELGTEIESWTPGVAVELARAFGNTRLSAGFGLASYSAISNLPNPELLGPVYQQLVAPELSLYATRATTVAFGASFKQRLGAHTALLLRGHGETLSGRESETPLTFTPTGSRTLWNISLSVLLAD